MKNRIIKIGGIGDYVVFLNVDKDTAISRYEKFYGKKIDSEDIKEYEITDQFWAYDVWVIYNENYEL